MKTQGALDQKLVDSEIPHPGASLPARGGPSEGMKPKPEELRKILRENFEPMVGRLNEALRGEALQELEPTLKRIGRGGTTPHWFANLLASKSLHYKDGKSIGSVVEMLLVAILETSIFARLKLKLRVNPARGMDLPDLELGVKSPSTNYCTSEPFFSAYERLLGSSHALLVLLTDYQKTKKKKAPLKLKILKWKYLEKTQIADKNLCELARKVRGPILQANPVWAQKMFRFLAHANQSDWRARQLLRILSSFTEQHEIIAAVGRARAAFKKQNKVAESKDQPVLCDSELEAVESIRGAQPIELGVIDALDNWVIENLQDAARMPSAAQFTTLAEGPLNGKIGMSFALQWRYNFGRLFGEG